MLLDQHYRERENGVVHPHALEKMAGIWRRGDSGKLRFGQEVVRIQNGGVVSTNAMDQLKSVLMHGAMTFEAAPNSGYGDWLGVEKYSMKQHYNAHDLDF